ncbi:Fc receptor-like protein 5, partial [Scomber scombrus]|uniref:Fc receptor-like protein 5 n=1 Tax=Scomber scombrus TaxID=13677 RepID=UPI002DDC4A51
WKVWRYTSGSLKLSQCGNGWGSQTSSACIISSAKLSDSSVYWCESKHRERSSTVNITVTGGSVILQSPVLPVMEGDDVTLHCKTKTSNLPADFYKDGSLINTEPADNITIRHVSKSTEGFYKCNSSSHGESPSSWISVTGNSVRVNLTVSPDSSQHFEYRSLNLSCGENSSFTGWNVRRFIDKKAITSCGDDWGSPTSFGCKIQTAKRPDTGIYWCETDAKQLSNSVSITVHGRNESVILQSPVLPVMEGDDVTLHCKTKTSNLPADFYKDGSLIRTESAGHMTIHHVSKSDEGLYKCNSSSHGESPSSWLFVRDLPPAETEPARDSLLRIIRHVVKFGTFSITTVLMVFSFLHKPRAPSAKRGPADQQQQAVSVATAPSLPTGEDDVTTEHHF